MHALIWLFLLARVLAAWMSSININQLEWLSSLSHTILPSAASLLQVEAMLGIKRKGDSSMPPPPPKHPKH